MALTLAQLKRSLHLTETIEKLQAELSSIFGGISDAITPSSSSTKKIRKKRKMSAAGRANIVAAQKARWAKAKAAAATKTAAAPAAKKGKPGRKKAAK